MNSSLRNRLLVGVVGMVLVIGAGSVGYYLIGNGQWTLFDCLYMTVISVTTVGFGEVLPGMDSVGPRTFTIVLLVFGASILVYFASIITAFIVEGDLRNLLHLQRLRKRIKRMKDHIIVCGVGTTGRHIVEELLLAGTPVVAIDTSDATLREIEAQRRSPLFSYVVGDATEDDVMGQAGLPAARGVVAAMSHDKDNLYVCVSTRLSNPNARIVARCSELGHIEKIRRAGADVVVSPNYIGGMRMVSELLRPAVVRFLDEMLRDTRATYRIDEVKVPADSRYAGESLREARIRERFGMTVLAVRSNDASPWQYNPEADLRLAAGMVLVVLGSTEQVAGLRGSLG